MDKVAQMIRLVESALRVARIWESDPIAKLARVALIRELAALEQIQAHLRDGRDTPQLRRAYKCAKFNNAIVRRACDILKKRT